MARFRIGIAAVILTAALPATAFADMLDRYKAASEAQAQAMADFMISRVPDLEGIIPPPAWTSEADTIGGCVIETVRTDRGDDGVEAYVTAVEQMAAVPITSLSAMGAAVPELLTDMYFMDVAQTCGAMDLAMRQMQESGLMDMLANPEVMEALSAE